MVSAYSPWSAQQATPSLQAEHFSGPPGLGGYCWEQGQPPTPVLCGALRTEGGSGSILGTVPTAQRLPATPLAAAPVAAVEGAAEVQKLKPVATDAGIAGKPVSLMDLFQPAAPHTASKAASVATCTPSNSWPATPCSWPATPASELHWPAAGPFGVDWYAHQHGWQPMSEGAWAYQGMQLQSPHSSPEMLWAGEAHWPPEASLPRGDESPRTAVLKLCGAWGALAAKSKAGEPSTEGRRTEAQPGGG